VTEQGDRASGEYNEKSSQLNDLANAILQIWKDEAPLSDLDTVIYLFREALDRRPALHPLRLDLFKDLAGALVTRFSVTRQHEDLDQAISLHRNMMDELHGISTGTGAQVQDRVRVQSICPKFKFTIL
jgi:hypothetical protein